MAESDEGLSELPLDGAGTQLRRAREAAGLQLSDIAARTRIAERHLVSLETGNFSAMASRAYAIGFARSYARTLGLDEQAIAQAVRNDLDGQEPSSDRYQPAAFEPGDPARVPSERIAWIAALGALAVVVAGYILWRSFYAPAMSLPDAAAEASASQAPDAAAATPSLVAAQGPVVFTALEQGVWVRFSDAAGTQLMQKQMALGESYAVPPEANGPVIRTARPDALQISIGGRMIGRLAERQVNMMSEPVTAAALLARPPAAPSVLGPAAAPITQAPSSAAVPASRASQAPPREATRPAPAARPVAITPAPAPAAGAVAIPVVQPLPQSSTVSQ